MNKFTFIDLFAGIGGFHLAMESLGGECVFASEIDVYARKTYKHNFKNKNPELFQNELFNDDIRKISSDTIPDFDVLCAGFPCQPFSQAGYKRGFDDVHNSERGNLFFNIVDIIEAKRPQAFFLENVRGIVNHDNGRTFKVIQDILVNELGYSFNFKVVNASDYGLPQLRPRAFMIGFRDESILSNFTFPEKIPLKFNMSDVWKGTCSREIGFTLRVGGRGSNINDRRNWDAYYVDGEVKKVMPEQAKKMQGFPESFEFPVNNTQAMKQLGNSVAVDAIRECGRVLVERMQELNKNNTVKTKNTKNKGEWTEIYTFLKLLNDKKLYLADKNLNIKNGSDIFYVSRVTTLDLDRSCLIKDDDKILVQDNDGKYKHLLDIQEFLDNKIISNLAKNIKQGSGTFEMPEFEIIQQKLGISIKGGNSSQKSDIVIDFFHNEHELKNQGFGIKSFLGSKPTLLNASGSNTNFIFRLDNVEKENIDVINSINTKSKLKDRINKVFDLGGNFVFERLEANSMHYNLTMVDSLIPEIVSKMLLEFYCNRTNSIQENIEIIGKFFPNIDTLQIKVKVKRLLVSILLGFFSGKKWDGQYKALGNIVVKDNGEQVGFHIIDLPSLEDYLLENIKFDTPSSTRHRFGSAFIEDDKLYFKLNMQLRF